MGALSMVNYRIQRNHEKCLGCGECVIQCPTRAWVRSEKEVLPSDARLAGRRTRGWARILSSGPTRRGILKIITNTYDYVREYIDLSAPGQGTHRLHRGPDGV